MRRFEIFSTQSEIFISPVTYLTRLFCIIQVGKTVPYLQANVEHTQSYRQLRHASVYRTVGALRLRPVRVPAPDLTVEFS
jgi:hypothetical protein